MQTPRPSSQTLSPSRKRSVAVRDAGDASASLALAYPRPNGAWLFPSLVVAAFFTGLLVSYRVWAGDMRAAAASGAGDVRAGTASGAVDARALAASNDGKAPKSAVDFEGLRMEVNPPEGYRIGERYGDLGPRLLAAGVIDYDAFAALYDQAGQPLDALQIEALLRGSDEQVVISPDNSYFLLNFFWAVGLANKNSILTEGPMVKYSDGKIETFASTGGWRISTKPVTDLYASMDLIPLTPEQQSRVEEVASAVYRPCCGNPTSFPDCNHGMAMLGILELMASNNATLDEMFAAAKYVNAYWFPGQAFETTLYLETNKGIDFAQADPRMLTGAGLASGKGFAAIHQDLQISGLLPQETGGSGSCTN